MFKDLIEFPKRPKLLSPAIMAYIGDSLFELFIRNFLLEQKVCKPNQLHKQAINYVNATSQAKLLEEIREELTEKETTIVRRGRNVKTSIPQNANSKDYRYSTAFEALLGYLYLSKAEERLMELFDIIKTKIIEEDHYGS